MAVALPLWLSLSACSPTHLPGAPEPPTTSKGALVPTSTSTSTSGTGTSGTASPTTTSTTIPPTTAVTAPPTTPAPANVTYNTAATASYGLGPEPGNWDIHAQAAAGWYLSLQQILAQVWPSAFFTEPGGTQVLDTSLLVSATEVSSQPQTVVYQINPRAVWSDGTPLTYADFVYNWQAQSGRSRFSDVGGTPYKPLDEAGYDDISEVTGSPADPYTATVTFSSPYNDWRSLFSYLMPAHIARTVGFGSGFTDPVADLVSAGPYLVSQVHQGYSLQLVRNARYWGTPGNLALITYYFTSTAAEMVNALAAHELDVATVPAGPGTYQQLRAAGRLEVRGVATASYEDLDFNQSSASLSSPVLRQAIMMALDRSTMAADVLAPYGLSAVPVENRLYLPGESGYSADGTGYDKPSPAAALALLTANGYTFTGGALHRPDGRPVELSLFVPSADPVAQQLGAQLAGSCAAIGVTLTVVEGGPPAAADGPNSAWAGSLWAAGAGAGARSSAGGGTGQGVAPPPGWQMAIELRQVPVDPSIIAGRYATGGADNIDGYSSPAMDALLARIPAATPAQLATLYAEVDGQAWADFVDLPLVALPVLVVVGPDLLNVVPGPYFGDMAWDEQAWGFRSP
jgi:peptide/nickel transport system substrate-binding protein